MTTSKNAGIITREMRWKGTVGQMADRVGATIIGPNGRRADGRKIER
jgi:hypothetical protein